MVLFHNVIQMLPLDHLNWDRAAKDFQHLVWGPDASRISSAFVDDNLARKAVDLQHLREEFGGGRFISTLRKHEIKRLAVVVDSPIETKPRVRAHSQ